MTKSMRSLHVCLVLMCIVASYMATTRAMASELTDANSLYVENRNQGFVRTQGTVLMLNGRPYRFAAGNSYEMLVSTAAADDQFQTLTKLHLNALRMWGFWNGFDEKVETLQPRAGEFSQQGFAKLDYVIWQAGQRGIRLILPLLNFWADFGGVDTYLAWGCAGGSSDKAAFFANDTCKQWYKNYIYYVLNRKNSYSGITYKDDPTIMMWEPINEIRGSSWGSDKNIAAKWLNEMAYYIKSIDTNHLVGSGEEGFYENHTSGNQDYPWRNQEGTDFYLNSASPYIDVLSIHGWPYQWPMSDGPEAFLVKWIEEHLKDAQQFARGAGKPLYMGEFGYQITRTGDSTLQLRNRVMAAVFNYAISTHQLPNNLTGVGFWHLTARHNVEAAVGKGLMFEVFCPEDVSTCQLIDDFAQRMVY